MGWGAYLEGRTASGLWSGAQLEEHINLLEMRAVFLSLRQFQAVIQGQSLLVATDNSTVVAYLQNQGGTHSFSLYHLSKEILLLCHSLNIFLSVRHVPGSQNLLADALSRSPCSSEHRMGNSSISVSGDHSSLGSSSYRSFCHQSESQIGDLRFSHSRRESLGSRCYDPILEGNVQLHVPSFSSSSKDLAQDSEGSLQDHSYCSGLVKTVLVPRTTTSVLCEAPLFASKRGSTVSIQRKKTASRSGESPSARLVVVRDSLRKGGFSEGATKRISGSVRQSTGAVYDSKWSIFSLATGRRRSEIHALSISESCLRFASDKSSVTLLTDPSFLAKNQLPDKGSGIITIPALPPTSDNQVLCPVRALLVYLASSAKLRSAGSSRLFIPIKKGISDISAKTISTWICNTVILAYKSASSEVLVKHQVKAHEVRALASSWNIFNSSSMSEIMSAGFGGLIVPFITIIYGPCLFIVTTSIL
ncbi:unnamed protein product [Mytilus edulis]|uniref:RNase H type-1 domain-containing protein n=1 Tax=Mytilus edulis TaxID=6550 RepID=A0A8S3PP64_MYTED|nr:unnamed protein product [Mytilus edulis]